MSQQEAMPQQPEVPAGGSDRLVAFADVAALAVMVAEVFVYVMFAPPEEPEKNPGTGFYVWWLLMLCVAAQAGLALFAAKVQAEPKKMLTLEATPYLLLGLSVVLFPPFAVITLVAAVGLRLTLDLAVAQRPVLRELVPDFEAKTRGALDAFTPRVCDAMAKAAVVLELASLLVLPFCGSFPALALFAPFLVLRYRVSAAAHGVWDSIGDGIDAGLQNERVPSSVAGGYKKAMVYVHKVTDF